MVPQHTMRHRITLIPGDGIGPEVTRSVLQIIDAAGVQVDWEREDAGETAVEQCGEPLPARLLDSIRRTTLVTRASALGAGPGRTAVQSRTQASAVERVIGSPWVAVG